MDLKVSAFVKQESMIIDKVDEGNTEALIEHNTRRSWDKWLES